MQAPTLPNAGVVICSESTSERKLAGKYEQFVNNGVLDAAAQAPAGGAVPGRLSAPGGGGAALGWVSTAAAAPGAHGAALLKGVGDLAVGSRVSLPEPQLGKFWSK